MVVFITHTVLSGTVNYDTKKYTEKILSMHCLSVSVPGYYSCYICLMDFKNFCWVHLFICIMVRYCFHVPVLGVLWDILSGYWTYRVILIPVQIGFPYSFYALIFGGSTCCNTFLWPVAKKKTRTQLQKYSWAFKMLSRSYIIWLLQQLSSSAGRSVKRLPKSRRV